MSNTVKNNWIIVAPVRVSCGALKICEFVTHIYLFKCLLLEDGRT